MRRVRVKCRGKVVSRVLHHTKSGRSYVMERKRGGGVKRKYID
jgi:hypothetical protein